MSEHTHSHSHHGDGGGHGHGHSHSHSPPPEDTFDSQSLYKHINIDQVTTMNESEPDAGKGVIKPWSERYDTTKILESDADEQLIMFIPFTGMVKLYSLLLRTAPTSSAPRTLKLFKNRTDVDFSIAEDLKADEQLEHNNSIADIVEYPLKRAIFSNVKSLTLFVQDNYGDDVSMISYIGLRGEWKELSKDPVITIYEAAANPADHKNLVGAENFMSEYSGGA
ncbi:galactose-binding domain-like protein [Myxozyma melibiosi]|uniref:Galactose-binding domain-like protein n=1 Tax=Myxozyma melibiosi TaxID=54550 RepID=A0ABR1F9R5_9ASCO